MGQVVVSEADDLQNGETAIKVDGLQAGAIYRRLHDCLFRQDDRFGWRVVGSGRLPDGNYIVIDPTTDGDKA